MSRVQRSIYREDARFMNDAEVLVALNSTCAIGRSRDARGAFDPFWFCDAGMLKAEIKRRGLKLVRRPIKECVP